MNVDPALAQVAWEIVKIAYENCRDEIRNETSFLTDGFVDVYKTLQKELGVSQPTQGKVIIEAIVHDD